MPKLVKLGLLLELSPVFSATKCVYVPLLFLCPPLRPYIMVSLPLVLSFSM